MSTAKFIMLHFSALSSITNGKIISLHHDGAITNLVIDSRKISQIEGALFFAIKGERHNGHNHIAQLYASGLRHFVVEDELAVEQYPEGNFIKVNSSIHALQSIATFHRTQFTIPVVGITGSNGKTIIKEWLYQVLSKDFSIVKNPGSYNSQVGVSLSVWQMQSHHQLAIFEAGISTVDEMELLENIIKPTIGIFTNIGSAHDEGFKNTAQKINEKLRLFKNVEVVIYNQNQVDVHACVKENHLPSLSWAINNTADIPIIRHNNHYSFTYKGNTFQLDLSFQDQASIENVFHCIVLMAYLNYDEMKIQDRINNLRSVAMRLEMKEGINQNQVIDDTYNNDVGGLQISLDFLVSQQQKKNKRLILSDILQSGLEDEQLVKKISVLVNAGHLQQFIGIGPSLFKYQHYFNISSQFYNSTDEFLKNFNTDKIQNELVLVKGARKFEFEKIVAQLQKKVHGTVMEIDLGAMVSNLNFFKSRLKPDTKVMAMVKAFAYGSGSNEVASLLQYHQVDYLGVAYADEGVELRKNNITLPIMVMNPSEESFHTLMMYDLEPELYSFKILHALLHFLQGKSCVVHVKLDTGMHRLGFEHSDLHALIEILTSNPQLKVGSIFSHLAGADENQHDNFSKQQGSKFVQAADLISDMLGYKPLYHLLNSPGILRLPELQFNMVRLGIGLYGVDPTSEGFHQLKPVATLKTIISQIKTIPAGETIGYGRSGKAEKNMTIATIAIGYADGFNRAFSRGVGEVLINNIKAKVIGNVCMDMTMIDITDIEAEEGDEVIIFGNNLPIHQVASAINTIPYEILTNTSDRVKRIFVAESI